MCLSAVKKLLSHSLTKARCSVLAVKNVVAVVVITRAVVVIVMIALYLQIAEEISY